MIDKKETFSELAGRLDIALKNLSDRSMDLGRKEKEYSAAQDEYNKALSAVQGLKDVMDDSLSNIVGEKTSRVRVA